MEGDCVHINTWGNHPRAVAAIALAAASAPARTIADYFEGIGEPSAVDSAGVTPVGWDCGDSSCCDPCGEPTCAADECCGAGCCSGAAGCGDVCCGSNCCGGQACCDKNCGLLGQGVLTYDACAEGCILPELLLGCFCTTEPGFDDFISPMTNPVFFEDPRHVTELRGIFLHHQVPLTAFGGDIQLYALQIRARLTEKLSLIAAKDGFIVSDNPLIQDGWADVDLGLKYSLFRDPQNQRLLSAGLVYDMPVGSTRSQQAQGDGEFHMFMTGGTKLGRCGHWLSAFGGIIPVDQNANASLVYWSNHWDYQFRRGWYALTELNWFHYAVDGGGGLNGVEGGDLFNLGSTNVEGNDIVTMAWGMKYKPNRKAELGVAWEVPLTERRDVLESRLTVDMILRY